jgi:uncharacterized protein (DUF433 family)
MTPTTLHADPLPLRVEPDGTIRVGDSRVTLDIVISDYEHGASAETIAYSYDTLRLADVHAVLAYYLNHRADVAAYLDRRRQQAEEIRKKVEAAGLTNPNFWQELQERYARLKQSNGSATDS